jgi:hypothetical protein
LLIEVKAKLRLEDTLVPWIFMSNGTHLSNIPGHLKDWPVYMTMGNLYSKVHQMPSIHPIVRVALLAIQTITAQFFSTV